MKKKALTVILPLSVVMVITACGGKVDTAEVEETTVIEESTEADAQEEAEAKAQEEAAAEEEVSTVDEEAAEETEVVEAEVIIDEEPVEIDEDYDPALQYEGKPYSVSDYVLECDRRNEYGVYSNSCFDLDQYLGEDGHLIISGEEFNNPAFTTYTGRWAYPEITQCDSMNDMVLQYRMDASEGFSFTDKSGNPASLSIQSGPGFYDSMSKYSSESDDLLTGGSIPVFTANTVDGTTVVIKSLSPSLFNENYYSIEYVFKVGNFAVIIECAETPEGEDYIELTEEEIQDIIDNIKLTNGLER